MGSKRISRLDAGATLAGAERAVRRQRKADLDRARHVLHWCDLNAEDPQARPGAVPVAHGGDRLVDLGGDGTPKVAELSLGELAIALGRGVIATRNEAADLLDLRHRLPQLWAAVQTLEVEVWVARKIARMARRLSRDRLGIVDAAVAAAVHLHPGDLERIAEAKIIEADPDAHAARVRQEAARTGVWLPARRPGQRVTDLDPEPDVQPVTARISTADALELKETLEDLADELAAQHQRTGEDLPTRDQLRAQALGILANPHTAVRFLDGLHDDGLHDPEPDPGPVPTAGPDTPTAQPEPQPAPAPEPAPQGGRGRHRTRLPATLYVHLTPEVLTGQAPGVARVEGLGPLLLDQVAELLRHREITLTPVIDLNTRAHVNGYEHPEAVKHRTLLRTHGSVFPHSPSRGRGLDHDHPTPYDPGGPPGQTGDHNDAP